MSIPLNQCEQCNYNYLWIDYYERSRMGFCSPRCYNIFLKLRKSLFWIIKRKVALRLYKESTIG